VAFCGGAGGGGVAFCGGGGEMLSKMRSARDAAIAVAISRFIYVAVGRVKKLMYLEYIASARGAAAPH